jgi:hypothetical protein
MNRIIFIFILICLVACGQSKKGVTNPGEKFEAKFVRLMNDTSKMMLIQNVVINYDELYAEADSALLEKPIETVTLFSPKKVIFKKEKLILNENNDTIRYNKKEGKLYSN